METRVEDREKALVGFSYVLAGPICILGFLFTVFLVTYFCSDTFIQTSCLVVGHGLSQQQIKGHICFNSEAQMTPCCNQWWQVEVIMNTTTILSETITTYDCEAYYVSGTYNCWYKDNFDDLRWYGSGKNGALELMIIVGVLLFGFILLLIGVIIVIRIRSKQNDVVNDDSSTIKYGTF